MNRKFARKLKSELAIKLAEAMDKKGIYTYEQLIKYCNLDIKNITHFSDVLTGKQKIKEQDLIKISNKLDIPIDYFRRKMKCDIRYYVEEYIPIDDTILLKEKKEKI